MITSWIRNRILHSLIAIRLTTDEKAIVQDSIAQKYAVAIPRAIAFSIAAIVPVLFLDTSVIVTVLIPITMVAGTAWFSISLANMKQKFERFGLELTANVFEAFAISLGLLFVLSVGSLTEALWRDAIVQIPARPLWDAIAMIIGIGVVGNVTYKIFIGALKYDVNDAMLTGQNEAAERFFRKSLSSLHAVADQLQGGRQLQVANYLIGSACHEVFISIRDLDVALNVDQQIEHARQLMKGAAMSLEEADGIALKLIRAFLDLAQSPRTEDTKKRLRMINEEMHCIQANNGDNQAMTDVRLAMIFTHMAELLETDGELLFQNAPTADR